MQEKLVDQEGLTFLFEINNIRIFCGGMGFCWNRVTDSSPVLVFLISRLKLDSGGFIFDNVNYLHVSGFPLLM